MNKGDRKATKANNKNSNMEVHHHPQLEHKPKPFKEYLLESFMIFIAVMMGFIAENVRQVIDDNEHVTQLTTRLVSDLQADSLQLNETYSGEVQVLKYNDTLLNLLQQPLQKADTRKIQIMIARCHSMWPFYPSAGAMTAIKNELHLKQFSNSEMINHFSSYEAHLELLHLAQDINQQYQRSYLDSFLTQHLTPANMVAAFEKSDMPDIKMRNLTQADLDQLAADIVLIRVITKEQIRDQAWLKDDVVTMLNYVRGHFKLENGKGKSVDKKSAQDPAK